MSAFSPGSRLFLLSWLPLLSRAFGFVSVASGWRLDVVLGEVWLRTLLLCDVLWNLFFPYGVSNFGGAAFDEPWVERFSVTSR